MLACSRVARYLAIGVLPFAIAGCPTDPNGNGNGNGNGNANGNGNTQTGKLSAFKSSDELLNYFRDNLRQQQRNSFIPRNFLFAPAADNATATAEAGFGADASADGATFTRTNLQEAGVDEGDVMKTDGTFVYLIRDNTLRIVRATPTAQLGEVGRLDLGFYAGAIYLNGSKLIALGYGYNLASSDVEILIWPPYYADSKVHVAEVDISDPANPTISNQIELDGSLVDSRLVDNRLILITTIMPDLPDNPTILETADLSLDQILPKARSASSETDVAPWSAWFHPEGFGGYNVTAVVTLDASNVETILGSLAIIADAGSIYATEDSLYVTDTDYTFDDEAREKTTIHKIAFGDDGAPRYVATGTVSGRPLNQFSLGEHNGLLRIATYSSNFGFGIPVAADDIAVSNGGGGASAGSPGAANPTTATDEPAPAKEDAPQQDSEVAPPPPSNSLFVLSESNGELVETGKIDGIAPGERLYAVRFLGDRAFLVTFRQIDPLFVVDLADPANPQLRGELKIPGYSDYLHPYGDLLIGVGRTADASDTIQLSLFNVADLSNPTVIQQLAIGEVGSWSEVSATHKAFAFDAATGRLAIPAILTDFDPRRGFNFAAFQGAIAFQVTESGFTELNRVQSVDEKDFYASWQRPLFIGDTLYAVSPLGVGATGFTDVSDVAFTPISE